jgi:hypothetical protein
MLSGALKNKHDIYKTSFSLNKLDQLLTKYDMMKSSKNHYLFSPVNQWCLVPVKSFLPHDMSSAPTIFCLPIANTFHIFKPVEWQQTLLSDGLIYACGR